MDDSSYLSKDFSDPYFNIKDLKNFRFQQLQKFSELLQHNYIKLIITYPVTFLNKKFNLYQNGTHKKIQYFTEQLNKHHIAFIGTPKLSFYDCYYSFDTPYHLNAEGAILRTLFLADNIIAYLNNSTPDSSEKYIMQKQIEAKNILQQYRLKGYLTK